MSKIFSDTEKAYRKHSMKELCILYARKISAGLSWFHLHATMTKDADLLNQGGCHILWYCPTRSDHYAVYSESQTCISSAAVQIYNGNRCSFHFVSFSYYRSLIYRYIFLVNTLFILNYSLFYLCPKEKLSSFDKFMENIDRDIF